MAKKHDIDVDSAIRKAQLMATIGTTSCSPYRTPHSTLGSAKEANIRPCAVLHARAQCTCNTHIKHCNRARGTGNVREKLDSQPGVGQLELPGTLCLNPDTGSLRATIVIQLHSSGLESCVELLPARELRTQGSLAPDGHVQLQADEGQGISIAMQRFLLEPARDGGPTYALLWDPVW